MYVCTAEGGNRPSPESEHNFSLVVYFFIELQSSLQNKLSLFGHMGQPNDISAQSYDFLSVFLCQNMAKEKMA